MEASHQLHMGPSAQNVPGLTDLQPFIVHNHAHKYSVPLFLQSTELILTDGSYQVAQVGSGQEIPYTTRIMGIYLVIEANNGLILIWDQKTSIFIKLSPAFNVSLSSLHPQLYCICHAKPYAVFLRKVICININPDRVVSVVCVEIMMAMPTMTSPQEAKKSLLMLRHLATAGSSLPAAQNQWLL